MITTKGFATAEPVQRQAGRFASNDYQRSSSVSSLINKLNWSSLQECRTIIDLLLFYEIQYDLVALPFPSELHLNSTCAIEVPYETQASLSTLGD